MKQKKKKIIVANTHVCKYSGCTKMNSHNSKYCIEHKKIVATEWQSAKAEKDKQQAMKVKAQQERREAEQKLHRPKTPGIVKEFMNVVNGGANR